MGTTNQVTDGLTNQVTDGPANQPTMSHQQVTRLAEAARNLANEHRDAAGSIEPTVDVLIRAIVTEAIDELEVAHWGWEPKQFADHVRKLVNRRVERQLERLYSGQEV